MSHLRRLLELRIELGWSHTLGCWYEYFDDGYLLSEEEV